MRLLLLCVSVLLVPAGVNAGDSDYDRATLRGVKAVNVVIDPIDPVLENQGLTQDLLRMRIEDRLRDAGIMVDPKALEFLGLRIDASANRKGPSSLAFALGFYQRVALLRDQSIHTATQTWDVTLMLVVQPKPLVQSSLNTVDQLADRFVTAYQAANK